MKLTIAGDFCPRGRIKEKIKNKDFSFLDEVKDVLKDSDYNIVNWECPIIDDTCNPIDKTGPNLGCDENSLDSVVYAGFNCVTLSNNHFRDYGDEGVKKTIEACERRGLDYCGGGQNYEKASKILYKSIRDKILAIINICENEWSIATENRGGSAPLDPINNSYTIKEAKKNADFVLVIVHGGIELYNLPTPRMKQLYRFFIDCGSDTVVNHHQHCYSGFEIYEGKPIIYGVGNFCFDNEKPSTGWDEGYLVHLIFEKDKINCRTLPYKQCTAGSASVSFIKDRVIFDNEIEELNTIIAEDKLLRDHFGKLCEDGLRKYAPILYPYKNMYLKALAMRGLLPPFLSRYRLKYLRAFISCESYHERLLVFLNNKLS